LKGGGEKDSEYPKKKEGNKKCPLYDGPEKHSTKGGKGHMLEVGGERKKDKKKRGVGEKTVLVKGKGSVSALGGKGGESLSSQGRESSVGGGSDGKEKKGVIMMGGWEF